MTLKEISWDLLEIVRAGSVSKSETISIRQIESWIASYRALLIKQAYEKSYYTSPQLIQSLNCISLNQVDKAECCDIGITSCTVLKSAVVMPKVTRSNTGGDLITFVGAIDGKPFQLLSEQRAYWYQWRPWVFNDTYAYLKNNYMYIINNPGLEKFTLRAVFEDPMDIVNYINSCTGVPCYSVDDEYPISIDMLPTLKALILKQELGIMTISASDKNNDASNIQTPNTLKAK